MALTDSLIAAWELDEASGNRSDSHSNGLTLTDNGTVGAATGLVYGNAASFASASTEYLSRASESLLQMGDIDFTIEAWVYPTDVTTNRQIVSKDDETNGREYTLDLKPAAPRLYIAGGAGSDLVEWGSALSTNTWYHILASHKTSNSELRIRVNLGTPVTATASSAPPTGTAQFRIGAREYASAEGYMEGRIGPVRIWKRLLTTDEETSLYNSGSGLAYASFGGGRTTKNSRSNPLGVRAGLHRAVVTKR